MSLQEWLAAREDRCEHGYHSTQGCTACGVRAGVRGQAIAAAGSPVERAKVEAALRQLAATGQPFTANEARALHGVIGPVVGGTFGALKAAGVIKHYDGGELTRSSGKSANGHHIFRWVAA